MVSGRSLALWRLVGLDVGAVVRYCVGLPEPLLAIRTQESSGVISASVRLTAVQLKQEINDSGICHVAIEMAKTGRRPVFVEGKDGEPDSVEWQDMSEASHIDMVKFIVKKVLPDAKEYDSVEDRKALDRWADVIAAEVVPVEV